MYVQYHKYFIEVEILRNRSVFVKHIHQNRTCLYSGQTQIKHTRMISEVSRVGDMNIQLILKNVKYYCVCTIITQAKILHHHFHCSFKTRCNAINLFYSWILWKDYQLWRRGAFYLKIFAERLPAMKKRFLYLDVSPLRFHQFNDHFPQLFRISQLPGIIK
jgi:hypothetical protein